jgi:hypothetical protein
MKHSSLLKVAHFFLRYNFKCSFLRNEKLKKCTFLLYNQALIYIVLEYKMEQ